MHPGNILITPTGSVVIDWLNAGIGPPAADIARTLFLLRASAIPSGIPAIQRSIIAQFRRWFAAGYLHEYRRLGALDERHVEQWRLPVLAARLGEEIEAERAPLLALIERELAASGHSLGRVIWAVDSSPTRLPDRAARWHCAADTRPTCAGSCVRLP